MMGFVVMPAAALCGDADAVRARSLAAAVMGWGIDVMLAVGAWVSGCRAR